VVTWWPRRGGDANAFPRCGAGAIDDVVAELQSSTSSLHSMQASAMLRWTQRLSGVGTR
jgi:hypothetical protein